MQKWLGLSLCLGIVGCAIPRDHATFSVPSGDPANGTFLSSQQLLVAGLVSESLRYGGKGRFFEAEVRLRKAFFLEPHNNNIAFNLAVVLAQSGSTEEAVTLLEELRVTLHDPPHVLMALADINNGEGKYSKARELLKKAFDTYKGAGNFPQAALVSRSISQIALAEGVEQEALCYSFEAFSLDPNAQQLGYHGILLVGLNLFKEAELFITNSITGNAALGSAPLVRHGLALAKYGQRDFKGALAQEEMAQDLLSADPDLGTEVNVVWWLLMQREPAEDRTDSLREQLESISPDVQRLKEKPIYRVVHWPAELRKDLDAVTLDS